MARIRVEDWTTEDQLLRIQGWARDGLTDKQIARNIGIGYSTFNRWKRDYQAILEALKKGKEPVDYQVENALLRRALGYDITEERIEARILRMEKGPDGKDRAIPDMNGAKVIRTKRHVPPDPASMIFWLKNRRPDVWREKAREREAPQAETNLLDALVDSTSGRIDTGDIPEILNAADHRDDLVEPPGPERS